eukprot:Awhi_evm2s15218
MNCDHCNKANIQNSSRRYVIHDYSHLRKGSHIDLDVHGPFYPTLGGSKLFIVLVCKATKFIWVIFIKAKSDCHSAVKKWIDSTFCFGMDIINFHSDSGTEFRSKNFSPMCKSKVIEQTFSPPYEATHNPLAERSIN